MDKVILKKNLLFHKNNLTRLIEFNENFSTLYSITILNISDEKIWPEEGVYVSALKNNILKIIDNLENNVLETRVCTNFEYNEPLENRNFLLDKLEINKDLIKSDILTKIKFYSGKSAYSLNIPHIIPIKEFSNIAMYTAKTHNLHFEKIKNGIYKRFNNEDFIVQFDKKSALSNKNYVHQTFIRLIELNYHDKLPANDSR
jgi:hypothetical protein